MKRHELSIEDIIWDSVRAHLRDFNTMLEGQIVNPMEMGKLYGELAQSLLEAIQKSGRSSLRFQAAAKALDLKTPKSQLESFLDESNASK